MPTFITGGIMKIQSRLSLISISMVIVAMTVVLLVSTLLIRDALENEAKAKLSAVLHARHSALQRHLDSTSNQIHVLANSRTLAEYLTEMTQAYAKLGKNAQTVLQQSYSAAHPDKNNALDSFDYARVHVQVASFFKNRHDTYGWGDMFLIDSDGNVLYSVMKNSDFATNLKTGPWKDGGLARSVVPLLQGAVPSVVSFADFERYAPAENRPAAFLAMPVFDQVKQVFLGVVAIQLPVEQINEVMKNTTGLGQSGETFVVGKDGWMLTESRFHKESSILATQLKTTAVTKVLQGKLGVEQLVDYRGLDVLVAYEPIRPFYNQSALGDHPQWGVIAKIDRAEVLDSFYHLRTMLLLTGVMLVLFALIAGVLGARSITRPLFALRDALTKLSRGEAVQVPNLERSDEIGEMASAAEAFRLMTQQVEHDHWISENVTVLTGAVSAESNLDKAADSVLHQLCEQLNVPVGAIYLLIDGAYKRIGSHGLARRSQTLDSFESGVGLIGQCARDNQSMVVSPVPSGLSVISSGLTEFPPYELVIYPIAHKDEVLAVLELAATKSLKPVEHEFLRMASSALGLHLANLHAAEHNIALLEKTSAQSVALRTNALYARSLIESSLDPLVTIGTDGRIMDVNTATENVTGAARGDLVGSDFSDYFTEPEKAQAGYKQVFTQGYVKDYPLAIRHSDGKITDVLYNASVFHDADGGVAGIFAAARDVTEKNKTDARLKEQQDELLRSNEEMRALTEELRSQTEEMKAQNEELKASQEELRAQQEEMQHKNDILESQSIQLKEVLTEANSKAEDLQRANQYKSEFLANMSHELRTPLNSVLILSRDLAENAENNLTPDQVESASVISESGTQLLTLINDILDLSKIEAGKLILVNETFRLDDLLVYLRRIFSPQADKKNLTFEINVDPAVSEKVTTDKQRLTQVMSNLLSNAIKFTDSGKVCVTVSRQNADLQFEVRDTGIGIPNDKIDHIFGAFQQVDGSTSRKYGGSGLGLAISRHLTELLGGLLEVSSELGKGSCFTIRLLNQFSALVHPEPEDVAQPVTMAADEGKRILVVEDDTRLSAIIARMIKALGFTPLCVESGEAALVEIARVPPTGILLDLGLPHMSGMELLNILKGDQKMTDIPVYIMSGTQDTGEAKVLGAIGFLKKPVTRDTISAAIKSMIVMGRKDSAKRLLLVDDSQVDIKAIKKLFAQDGFEMLTAHTGSDALSMLETQRFDTVILDLKLPDMTGFEWLKEASHMLNPPPVVVYSARELSETEIFELKQVAESIVNKTALNDRLREEVLLTVNLDMSAKKIAVSESHAGKKLLLVDDDARNLFALTRALRGKGYVTEVAADSARALELLAQERFDAVLTDIMMPEMDGYALIREIRAQGYADMPVIAITAKAMQGDDELCMQAGATAYLAKPIEIDKLLDMLKGI
jgi:PAS domain S-box-containing protein